MRTSPCPQDAHSLERDKQERKRVESLLKFYYLLGGGIFLFSLRRKGRPQKRGDIQDEKMQSRDWGSLRTEQRHRAEEGLCPVNVEGLSYSEERGKV